MCGGIWFQILGPQTEKARFPNWVRVRTTKAALVVEERSWRRPDSAVLNRTILLRYAALTMNGVHRHQGGDFQVKSSQVAFIVTHDNRTGLI